ncbi:MAG TPA: isoleucine--tRNA ligase [Candidatus Sulfotelmatobacter sp.]|jgi:isoleucyl-tRNA synthetase|nr:isoleucine--tRNA ligase [Candidatus Sulfotelmatobacter sp.]
MFKPVSPKVDFAKLEVEINNYWKKNKIFEKSVSMRPVEKRWTFLDGPPFVTGMPHYGSLLSSLPKDVFGRYWTMKGYRVRRVWGWDGHGLPIENKVENELDLKSKKDIEEVVGVKKFIDECKHYVNVISSDWEWYVDRIGRWVDFKNAYKTWNIDYMESVMWVFKQMYTKGYIYKGLRVSLYCPHCATPISNFEVAMDVDNYKEIQDDTTTYKYKVVGEQNTYFLAWSTTPWNKIVTTALAVNPKFIYAIVSQNDDIYILAKSTLKMLGDKDSYKILDEVNGSELVGKKFEPHYDYYKDRVKKGVKVFEIISGDFVTAEEGTGIVTIAAYGEEDLKVMREQNVHVEMHLDDEGHIKSDFPQFGGLYYLKANKVVDEDLEKRGLVYKIQTQPHRVPLCWRCHTRLYYAPIDAWFVNVQELKPLMKQTNEKVNWFPKHFKHGRFLKSLENAPDWNISRNRYWGSPVPVWECDCGERFVPGSIKELEEASGKKIIDLHKPEIDEVTITCQKCDKKVRRVPEVLDSWIEAGSASFAERHFPFDSSEQLEDFFPPNFISEYTGQIRAWFYVLHVIGAALYQSQAFKNVAVTGVILGTDGRKMSKNFKNYPDPREMLEKYGGDALRLYLLGSPVMHGEDILISEEQYKMQVRTTMLILWNVYNFFITYANLDGWKPSKAFDQSESVLDEWIISLTEQLKQNVTESLDSYDTVASIDKLKVFVTDFSIWYIRRSRNRTGPSATDKTDKEAFYQTCYKVLITLVQLMAPITPFLSEELYRNLTNGESVHLSDWPEVKKATKIQKELLDHMQQVRKIVELGLAARKEQQIKVKQPLAKITVSLGEKEYQFKDNLAQLILDELNVKEIAYDEKKVSETRITLDTNLNDSLIAEGQAREIIRKIQEERKKLETSLDEKVIVSLENWPAAFEEYIKQQALIDSLTKGEFAVKRL